MLMCLGDVGAVEEHRVEAVLAFEDVVVVAGVPDERVVAGAHEGGVVAVAAVDQVVALGADDEVAAEAAVHRELDAVGLEAGRVDDVVAAQAVERQPVVGLFLEEDVDAAVQAEHVDPAGVAAAPKTSAPFVPLTVIESAARRRRRWGREGRGRSGRVGAGEVADTMLSARRGRGTRCSRRRRGPS
jgi:hypothetical protein